ncbi:Hypothetical Protein RradSPS_2042 [Rubrobacter radiotolerans]|uniref:Selenoprotein B, glycine/betaine/sarcosine/D-proline reductase family n=1 Tax=Rubrobacter radiotolerans TaxID=42256 RepID=A0A023X5P3_RUBRA|nr:hypothetical protein [Rubrobacter radiotolerans]AHY47325.1 Hypothetical Protein RradSPS_2042 [Rubrobacter radiotolerans]MDX5894729.1 hypothetical protein [Rubrobacter radiotolerans]
MIEKAGIPTVSVTMLEEVTRKVDPPRALFVDTPLGYPLGGLQDHEMRRRILEEALSLLTEQENLPLLRTFPLDAP